MDAGTVEKNFLKVNKIFGLIIGVWPYQNYRLKMAERFISITVMMSSFVTQVAHIVLNPTIEKVAMNLPYSIASFGTFVKMGNYFLDETKLITILNHIFEDWAAIKTKEEYEIMYKYSRRGLFITISYFLHIGVTEIFMLMWPMVPPILDIIMPLNVSRKRILLYPAYFWLDDEKYYVLLLGHMIIAILMTCFIFCACDTNYVYAVQHACGLLAIAKYRFKNVCKDLNDKENHAMPLEKIKYKSICESIKAHQHTLKYLKLIENSYHTYLFISLGLLIMAISVSLLEVANGSRKLVQATYLFAQLFHTFILTVQGQFVINELQDVYESIYESPWYTFSPRIRSLYVLSLRSCLNFPTLTAGGLIVLNLQSFAEIIKAAVSYYTVMQTT
ncbi:odorant receptor 22b-like isoform X1 [Apis florea]|uniref:odorant receptor 22b-like isoform X1 n=1 Tax=Apis florea TaxID=7463 RepID=UPI0012FF2FDE|nr:odorant receptor 22b-like isoform X1 [Apis florea]